VSKFGDPRTLAVATATLGTLVAASFLVQAAALGRPSRADLIAMQAIGALAQYHDSRATMTINGKHLTATCRQHLGRHGRVETVAIDHGRTLRKIGNTLMQAGKLALDEFELAGCPRTLANWLATWLNRGARVELKPAKVNGTRVYAVRVPSAKLGLLLFIARTDGLLVNLTISGGGIRGTSKLKYGLPSHVSWRSVIAHANGL